jgi:predicted nucleic acid-binding protein
MTVEQTQASINWLQSLLITIDSLTSVQALFSKPYLELALRLDLPLATNDKQLIDAALRCQVELLNPALN